MNSPEASDDPYVSLILTVSVNDYDKIWLFLSGPNQQCQFEWQNGSVFLAWFTQHTLCIASRGQYLTNGAETIKSDKTFNVL